jgi:hypothetical protein
MVPTLVIGRLHLRAATSGGHIWRPHLEATLGGLWNFPSSLTPDGNRQLTLCDIYHICCHRYPDLMGRMEEFGSMK